MKLVSKFLTLAASLAAFAVSARAVPTLVLYDVHSNILVVVQDNVGGPTPDGSALNNVVTWSGSVGEWFVNVTTGLVFGTNSQPIIDLNSVNVSHHTNGANVGSNITGDAGSWGYANLQIALVADGLNGGPGSFGPNLLGSGVEVAMGGTTNGDLYYSTWAGTGSFVGGSAFITQIDSQGPFGPGAFSNTSGGSIPPGTFTLSSLVDVAHYGNHAFKTTSFDLQTTVPDSSMTALLLGMGLLGVGLAARRSKA